MDQYDGFALKNLIQPGGIWARQLKSEFSNPLGGYVLLVGETEIIPSWYASKLPGPKWGGENDPESGTVPDTDLPYADTGSGPSLIVGRIIGDTASALTKTLQTSIGVYEGSAGYAFDRDSATMISGPGLGNFVNDVEAAANILIPEFTVSKMHWKDYYIEDTFNRIYDQYDALAVGDVLGDSKEEIIMADTSSGRIYVYDENMTQLQDFPCGYNGDGFGEGDKIAVGNYNIVMADVSADYLLIYNAYGVLQSALPMDLEASDGLAVGDVASDGYVEIIVADDSANRIYVYTLGGAKIFDFAQNFGNFDSLAVGDVMLDDKEEIVVADFSSNNLRIFSANGQLKGSRDFGENWLGRYGKGTRLFVGNFGTGGKEWILIAPTETYKHLFLYSWDDNKQEISDAGHPPFDFDQYDGLAVGNVRDIMGDTEHDEILIGDEGQNKIVILDPDVNHFSVRAHNNLPNFFQNVDLIYWSGHGNVNVWDGGINSHDNPNPVFPIDFSQHNPVVLTSSCLTGNYQEGGIEDKNIAESFLASGASVYIGSSQVSFYPSAKAAEKLMNDWASNETIGKAFTAVERYGWTIDGDWKFYAWEYNFYGDPKFGAIGGATLDEGLKASESTAEAEPPSSLQVEIPAYVVTKVDSLDKVEIPGGHLWVEPGELQVPFYSTSVECPAGYRIQDVVLAGRSGLVTETGLNVPMTPLVITRSNFESVPYLGPQTTSFPDEDYRWEVMENSDGSSTLVIVIYPFYYNPATTHSSFYNLYNFNIIYTASGLSVTNLTTDENVYQEGDTIKIDLNLNNPGETQDVIVSALVKRYGSDEIVDDLNLSTLNGLGGAAAFSTQWDSSGIEPGSYVVEVTLKDAAGNVLQRKAEMFQLGISSGEVTGFSVEPEHFDIGDAVDISLDFVNTGAIPITGKAIIRVQNNAGETMQEFSHEITDMSPGNTLNFSDVWNTSGFEEGAYHVVGYVSFDGKATEAVTVLISTSSCLADSDHDGDVDGKDLCSLANGSFDENELQTLAAEFGRIDCLQVE